MDRNALHHTIEIGSPAWILLNIGLVLGIFIVIYFSKNDKGKSIISPALGYLLIANFLFNQFYAIYLGTWQKDVHLPLHLCSFSTILSVIVLFFNKQWAYEFLIFWSAGAIHSFLTPEITDGASIYNHWEYGIAHAGVIITGIYATYRLNFTPRKHSWLKVMAYTQLTLPVVGLLNYLLDSNYMFIAQKPNAQNPFIIGEWPWYIIGLEFAVLLHFAAFYWIHNRIATIRNKGLLK
jgi:hypothetical integral membrane protein (TIGR02206 family)